MKTPADSPPSIELDAEIARAKVPPAAWYQDPPAYRAQLDRVFARSWQWVAARVPAEAGQAEPFTLLPESLDEPLVLTCDEDGTRHCLSNVCTHRGALVVRGKQCERRLRCRYHGRRFGLDGRLQAAPEFDGAEDFPRASDDLPRLPLQRLGPLAFTSLDPSVDFDAWIAPVRQRMAFVPFDSFVEGDSKHYDVASHWALYCDNYLEGFHIPYVHAGLAEALDVGAYREELFEHVSLQVGIARDGEEDVFELPADHVDHGQAVAGYYFFVYPNLMLNFYPWGLSLNLVLPRGLDRCRVFYREFLWRPELRDRGAGGDLHQVEMEDEEVVEDCQRGLRSRLYRRGRYAPTRERCVHHFHRRLLLDLNDNATR